MDTREWALIAFTILTQMSVGAFVVMGAVHWYVSRKAGSAEADYVSDRVLVVIGATLVLGMVASLFHLGDFLNAPRAINNFGQSWLSREIFTGVAFVIIGLVFVLLQWRKIGSSALRSAVAIIAAIVGLVFVYFQSRVYMVPIQPAWNSLATPISFFTATMLLGVMAIGPALIVTYLLQKRSAPEGSETRFNLLRDTIRWIALASIVLLGIELIVIPVYLTQLATQGPAALTTLGMFAEEFNLTFILRLVLGFLGAGILALFIYRDASVSGTKGLFIQLAFVAFVLVFIAEVMGRFLFYSTHVPVGL